MPIPVFMPEAAGQSVAVSAPKSAGGETVNAFADSELDGLPNYTSTTGPLINNDPTPEPSNPKRPFPWKTVILCAILFFLLGALVATILKFYNRDKPKPTNSPGGTSSILTVNNKQTLTVKGDLTVSGTTTLQDLIVNGSSLLQGGLTVNGDTTLNGNLNVNGNITANNFPGSGGGGTGAQGPQGPAGPSGPAGADGCGGSCVALQTSTPGTQQSGHINVSGTGLFGNVGVGTLTPGASLTVSRNSDGQAFNVNNLLVVNQATTQTTATGDDFAPSFNTALPFNGLFEPVRDVLDEGSGTCGSSDPTPNQGDYFAWDDGGRDQFDTFGCPAVKIGGIWQALPLYNKGVSDFSISSQTTFADGGDSGSGYGGSVVMGSDGFARMVAPLSLAGTGVYYLRCTDPSCTSPIQTLVNTDSAAYYPNVVLGSDGFARIVYYASDNDSIEYVRCTDQDCTTHVDANLGSGGGLNYGISLVLGSDDFARVVYAFNGYETHYVHCLDMDCATTSTPVVIGGNSNAYSNVHMVLGSDGFARIAYEDTDYTLKMARCSDADCTATITTNSIDNTGNDPGYYGVKLTLGSDGKMRVAYVDSSTEGNFNYALHFAVCGDENCSSIESNNTVADTNGASYGGFGMVLDQQNHASISYQDNILNQVSLLNCNNSACDAFDRQVVDSTTNYQGDYIMDLTKASDGLPRLFYAGCGDCSLHFTAFGAPAATTDTFSVGGTDIKVTQSWVNKFIYTMKIERTGGTDQTGTVRVSGNMGSDSDTNGSKGTFSAGGYDWRYCHNQDGSNNDPDIFISLLSADPAKAQAASCTWNIDDFSSQLDNAKLPLTLYVAAGYNATDQFENWAGQDFQPTTTIPGHGVTTKTTSLKAEDGSTLLEADATNKTLKVTDLLPLNPGSLASGALSQTNFGNGGLEEFGGGLAMGGDGFARMVADIYNSNSGQERAHFYRCTNASCSVRVDNIVSSDYTIYPTLVLGSDGFARITYYDASTDGLHFVRCTNADCTTRVDQDLDPSNRAGYYGISMTMAADGLARIAYVAYNSGLGQYEARYIRCSDADCSSPSPVLIASGTNNTGANAISLVIGADGLARIAHEDYNDLSLKMAVCNDVDCSAPVTQTIDGNGGNDPGYYGVRLAIGTDNKMRVVYADGNGSEDNFYDPLHYAVCSDANCSGFESNNSLASTIGDMNDGPGFLLDSSNMAQIMYEDNANGYVWWLTCSNDACSSHRTMVVDNSQSAQGDYIMQAALGSNGLPRLMYAGDGDYSVHYVQLASRSGLIDTTGTTIGTTASPFGQVASAGIITALINGPNGANLVLQDAGGNVGIGTDSPLAKLSIINDIDANTVLSVQGSLNQTGDLQQWINGTGNRVASIDSNGNLLVQSCNGCGSASQWQNNGSSIYYNGGNVGIGTSNPTYPLQVSGNVLFGAPPGSSLFTAAPLNLANNGAPGTLKTQLNLINGAGAAGAGSAIDFYTYTDQGNSVPGARLGVIDDGNFSGSFVFSTKAQGSSGNGALVERLRIASTGDVTIGGNLIVGSCTGCSPAGGSSINNGTSIQTSANFAIQSAAAGSIGGVIRAASSQSADLLELQDSSGTPLVAISSSGDISEYKTDAIFSLGTDANNKLRLKWDTTSTLADIQTIFGNTSQGALRLQTSGGSVQIASTTIGGNGKLIVGAPVTVDNSATVQFDAAGASIKGLVVQGAASQTADLLQTQDSTGTVMTSIDKLGNLVLRSTGSSSIDDGAVKLTQFGYDNAYLQNFYGSIHLSFNAQAKNVGGSGTVYDASDIASQIRIDSLGINLNVAPSGTAGNTITWKTGLRVAYDGSVQIGGFNQANSVVPLTVKGVSSQSGDLLQAQDSTGAVLDKIDSVGNLTVKAATINGNLTVNGHLITGNASGSTTVAALAACGTGCTASITGNDTSGIVTINVGTGPTTGSLVRITFANAYGASTRIQLTPSGSNGAAIQYCAANAGTTTFEICSNNAPTNGVQYLYYYHVEQ